MLTHAILGGVFVLGFGIGWRIVDRWLEQRREKRERGMRDVTPR